MDTIKTVLVSARETLAKWRDDDDPADSCVGCLLFHDGTAERDAAYELVYGLIQNDMHDWSDAHSIAERIALFDRAIASCDAPDAT